MILVAARVVRLLAFAVWVGAIVFFGAVVAPGAAHIFGTTERFADFIGHSILMLHSIGLWCGVALLLSVRLLGRRAHRVIVQAALILAMVVLTTLSTRLIVLPMERDRMLAGGNIGVLLAGSPLREDFDRRHVWSTRVEGAVLLLGLALGVLIGVENDYEPSAKAEPEKLFDLGNK